MSRFYYLQGLQRENAWRFEKGLKGREILCFAQYDIKTQGAIYVLIYRSPKLILFIGQRKKLQRCTLLEALQIYKLQARFGNDAGLFFAWVVYFFSAWQWMVIAYPNEYGGGHDSIIVVALDGSHLLAVLLDFVQIKLIAGVGAVLDVQTVSKGFDKVVDYHWLGGAVGVESPTAWTALPYLLLAGTGIEVAVLPCYLIQDVLEVVAFGAFALKGVGLDD